MPEDGGCDSHIHIVGDGRQHPFAAGRSYTPMPATLDRVIALAEPCGVRRFVIVQPSFYGTDNRVMLDALARLGPAGRGVAVVDPSSVTQAELAAMHAGGVRGLRLNLYSPGGTGPRASLAGQFAAVAAICVRLRWHVQVIAPIAMLTAAASVLTGSPVPVVIDHFGLPGEAGPDSDIGRQLLTLLACETVWIKLSAPYRSSRDAQALVPDAAWLAAMLATAPGRCVWGSDWPHTPAHAEGAEREASPPYRPLVYADVIAAFRRAMPSDALARRVLVDNPAALYGFASSGEG